MTLSARHSATWTQPFRAARPQLWAGLLLLLLLVLVALCAPLLARHDPLDFMIQTNAPPSWQHWMGTTLHGQDVFALWVYGARFSLKVGLVAGLCSVCLSIAIGVTAGYIGGWMDDALTFLMNIVVIVPPLPLLLVLTMGVTTVGYWRLVFILGLVTWGYAGRVLRSQTMSLRTRDFIDAAVASGAPPRHVILGELLPNLFDLVVYAFAYSTLLALQAEFSLEFLGASIRDNLETFGWGTLLNDARYDNAFIAGTWWQWLFPGLGIALTGAALTLITIGASGLVDPRRRRPRRDQAATLH